MVNDSGQTSVNLNPRAFQDTPLADLCLEDALVIGRRKSENLKPTDFRETSIRFSVKGLRNWLSVYIKDYADESFYHVLRDLSWHWASFCGTNSTLTAICKDYHAIRRDIAEMTSYTDLMDSLQETAWLEKFGRSSRPCTVLLPMEVLGVVGETGEAIGIPFSKFFQVGLAWSLSTNKRGLYGEWLGNIYTPLFAEVMAVAENRLDKIESVRCEMERRICKSLRQKAEGD